MVGCVYISNNFLGLLLLMMPLLLLSSSSSSQAAAMKFSVGGEDGWVVKPSQYYSQWAHQNRFQVNDILYFNYKKGNDLVLVVKKEDYDSCNINNLIHKMDDGNSTFLLNKPGIFFFISGNVDNCKNGQKVMVSVLAGKDKLPLVTPLSWSPLSVPSGHGGGDGGGWSGVQLRNCQVCCNVYGCLCC